MQKERKIWRDKGIKEQWGTPNIKIRRFIKDKVWQDEIMGAKADGEIIEIKALGKGGGKEKQDKKWDYARQPRITTYMKDYKKKGEEMRHEER